VQPEIFSVAISVSIGPQSAGGYMFAKTDQTGTKRYHALYYSAAADRLSFYYYSGVGEQSSVLHFSTPAPLDDGAAHQILLAVGGTRVWMTIDGQRTSALMSAQIGDCGAASQNCVFSIGHRESVFGGRYHLTGVIHHLSLYTNATLTAFPTFIDGLTSFSRIEMGYISGRNLPDGVYNSGTTLAQCVELCRAHPRCNSFDAGRTGSLYDGACYLSDAFESQIAPEYLRISPRYDYYERVGGRICTDL